MNSEKLMSTVVRIVFAGSLLLLGVAVLERVVNVFGYTIVPDMTYTPGRLLEFAAILLIAVIAMLLRQVRDELKRANRSRLSD